MTIFRVRPAMYEVFEHTADLGLRVTAETLGQLLVESARGLFYVICGELDQVRPRAEYSIRLAAAAPEYLLVDWLSELLYLFESQHVLLSEFSVELDQQGGLEAIARGEPIDAHRHQLEHEVKAITYHGLTVARTDAGWQAELILDI